MADIEFKVQFMSESLAGKGSCKGKPAECLARAAGGAIRPPELAGKAERGLQGRGGGKATPIPHLGHASFEDRSRRVPPTHSLCGAQLRAGGKPEPPQLTAVGSHNFPIFDGINAMA